MHLIKMPEDGLYRAGRWSDVEAYPGPAAPISLAQPLEDGFRWEDPTGSFATVKCSPSQESAIGRAIARYRPRTVGDNGSGIIQAIKDFMSGPPDDGEPELVDGTVPADLFDDLYSIHVPDRPVVFVDLEHEDTQRTLETQLAGTLAALGVRPRWENVAHEKDRRVTRLAIRALYSLCADGRFGPVAGIRCPDQPNSAWDAFVVWSPPRLLELSGDDVEFRWVARWDDDVIAAARTLGLELPESPSPS
jgi:hypothetical protein